MSVPDYQAETLSAAFQHNQQFFIHTERLTDKRRASQGRASEGGYGIVYKADLHGSDNSSEVRVVAVKELREKEILEDLLQALMGEIMPWARLQHSNILPFIGFSFDGRTASLISPWCANGNVMEYIKDHPILDRRKLVLGIASGLQYLHDREPPVIHGDLKAANVLMSNDDEPVPLLADFGLARFAADRPSGFSRSDGFHGTTRWASPELLMNSPTTTASDVWSFGCVVGEVMSSKIPLGDIRADIAVAAVLLNQNFSQDTLFPQIPNTHPLRRVLGLCWKRHWHERPSISEVRNQLQEIPISDWHIEPHKDRVLSKHPPDLEVQGPAGEPELEGDLVREGLPIQFDGFTETWKGQWTVPRLSASQQVAIRVFRIGNVEAREDFARQLSREVRIWKDLQHPNVLPLFGWCAAPWVAIVSPWREHRDIQRYLRTHPGADKLQLIHQVSNAVAYLHTRYPPVIHGDLIPSKVLINDREQAVIDFSKVDALGTGVTTGNYQDDPRYSGPELFGGAYESNTKGDVYTFAMLAITVLSGKRPFNNLLTTGSVLVHLMKGQKPKQDDHPFPDSLSLWPVFDRCWNRIPEERPEMGEVREQLRRCLLLKGSWTWLKGK